MCLHRFTVGLESGDGGYIGALQFFGSALITGTADGVVRLWDRRTGQSHRALRDCGHSDSITCLQFDDNYIISGSLDCSAVIWDLRASRALDRLKLASPITSLQLMHYLPPHLAASLNTDHTGTGAVTVPSSTLQSLQQKTLIWLAARDESIHSWNPNTFEHISYTSDHGLSDNNRRYLQSGPAALPGATPTVTRIRAIDGRNKIITAASDGIKIWDV
ncbi:Mitochondrial fission protein [Spiromyces aspiralis]|uniref:Mitochondrial fission protein n=1 Tax=Spiromyces aspiralis TaxID=68401 RepID=A0ACC1HPA7_9FUNG|nr:Mitochondrial fission protein [Spiromyces aspiralis]